MALKKLLKNSIASVLYRLVVVYAKMTPSKGGSKHLLIIKTDEIGDYVIFRNTLRLFRQSERYSGYKITLIGTFGWKSLFESLDSETVDDVIWIKKAEFNRNLSYRLSIFKKVRQGGFSNLVNCVYGSSIVLEDGLAWVAPCSEKITILGSLCNMPKRSINVQRYIYDEFIDGGDERIFDSIRNKVFLSKLLSLDSVPIDTKIYTKWNGQTSSYFSLFIGAGNPERRWPIEYFVQCAKYVNKVYGLTPSVFGGPTDEENGAKFLSLYGGLVNYYVAKTTLPEFLEMLNRSRFTLSVDTGPLHMAVAAGSPVVGLFSGRYYKRYAPYPKEITEQFYAVYPDFIDEVIANGDPSIYDPFVTLNSTIHLIQPEKVIEKINLVMAV